jgi:hypothetical protein
MQGEWQKVDTTKYAKNYMPPLATPSK